MKKFTSLSFMLVAALLMFSSCSKDDDGAPALDAALLEGEWIIEKTVISDGGETSTEEDDQTTYTFNADKTYHILRTVVVVEEGTYSLNGHILFLDSEGLAIPYEIKALTSTNLNLYLSMVTEIEGEGSYEYSETLYLSRAK